MAESEKIDHNDPEVLERLYRDEGMSLEKIAELTDVSATTILRRMDKFGIERRDPWHADSSVPYAGYRTTKRGYEKWEAWVPSEERSYVFAVHRLMAIAEYGFDAVANKDVHHKNGIPWDNRYDNLEVLDHADHISQHRRDADGDKLSKSDVKEIKSLLESGKLMDKEIAERYGVNPRHIYRIKTGRRWGYVD